MATGREHTPEQRFDLTSEARDLTWSSLDRGPGTFRGSGSSFDTILAALALRAHLDPGSTAPRHRTAVARWLGKGYLDEQREFNRLAINALEELTQRLDLLEAGMVQVGAEDSPETTSPD